MSKELAPIPADQIHAAQLAASTVTGQAIGWMALRDQSATIRTAGFFATVADRLISDTYRKVKESKAYVGMPYLGADGVMHSVATLDEYCRVFIGKSYRRCEELLSNRETVGDSLYEQAEALGLRQRDYNALKALPAEDREVISQALEAGADRETVIEQLVTLTERQIAQKAKLAEELTEAREDLAAKDQRAGTREKEIERLGKELRKAKRLQETATPDETAAELRRHAGAIVHEVRAAIIADGEDVSSLRTRVRELVEHGEANGVLHTAFLSGLFLEIERDLRALRDEYSIPAELVLDDEPAWLKEAKADGVI